MTYPDNVVVQAFRTVRHLTQLAEALSDAARYRRISPAVQTQIVHCTDRAEHIAQEFLPDSFGSWPEKTNWVRQSLLRDVEWMIAVIACDGVQEVLANSVLARPHTEELLSFATALRRNQNGEVCPAPGSAAVLKEKVNMPGFKDFIDQLKAAGVKIEGEAALAAKVAAADQWTEEVASLALVGRKDGIRFTRDSMDHPSNKQISAIVRGYPFTAIEQSHVVDNVVQA
ncbi:MULTISPECIES: hypothetical protein [Cupriavidus]|jgi:hypothetical protein|uniref:hypothetical protein n=1 Tax=Cupriavidus TaxID=106589 RepID=UPI00046765AB|nr:hypothetical protein [Cupriavidus metallidurans]KWW32408.1 hypothetical protein AU374_06008 [Cupriavidus metallidurans]